MAESFRNHRFSYTPEQSHIAPVETGTYYQQIIRPGSCVVSIGPYMLESDPTLCIAAHLLHDAGTIFVADPISKSNPLSDQAHDSNPAGPIAYAGNIDAYLQRIGQLRSVLGIPLIDPHWLGTTQGVHYIDLPQHQLADVIIDRGTSTWVFGQETEKEKRAQFFKTFQTYRQALSSKGMVVFQTNIESLQFFNWQTNTWSQSLQQAFYEAGFSSVAHIVAQDTHRLPISEDTYITLISLGVEGDPLHFSDSLLYEKLFRAVRLYEGSYVLEFSRNTGLGQHIRHNKDLFIATV